MPEKFRFLRFDVGVVINIPSPTPIHVHPKKVGYWVWVWVLYPYSYPYPNTQLFWVYTQYSMGVQIYFYLKLIKMTWNLLLIQFLIIFITLI
jgi:hypothetical protein